MYTEIELLVYTSLHALYDIQYNLDNASITEMCLYCRIWFRNCYFSNKTICSNICNNGLYINVYI